MFDAVSLQYHPEQFGSSQPDLSLSGAVVVVDLRRQEVARSSLALWEHLQLPRIEQYAAVRGCHDPSEFRKDALQLGRSRNLPIIGMAVVCDSDSPGKEIVDWAMWGRSAGFKMVAGVNTPELREYDDDTGRIFDFSYQAADLPGLLYLPSLLLRRHESMIGYDIADLVDIWRGRLGTVLPVASGARTLKDWLKKYNGSDLSWTLSCVGRIKLADFDEVARDIKGEYLGSDFVWANSYCEDSHETQFQLCIIW